ncbi:MAG: DUF362 domain-containing protein [Desulfobacterales bacterium]|jgi:uncharacterized protein (DUF362 family)|nr:DUF362 domain-containing protein [Desulfobacterales bacterium]
MYRVMIETASYDDVRRAVDRAFTLFPLKVAEKTVLVKPNVLRASSAQEGIVTHPALLRAVVEKLETMNPAAIVVGDNPGAVGYGANEASFEETGLMAAAKGYYHNIGNDSRKVAFDSRFMEAVSVSTAVLNADIIISLPKFKTHGLTVMTGAIKNSYGMLPGAQKANLHKLAGTPARFHDLIVEVFRLRIPDFFIVDAIVGMEGNGPASPDLRQIGRILASDNAVALDAVIATMMGMAPERLPFLCKAAREGLGAIDLSKISIIGELQPIPNFKLPPLSGEAILNNSSLQQLLRSKTVVRPHADPDLCTACGTCIDQCPVSALSMRENLPRVDEARCITCFCCQEICPEKAMVLR